MALFLFRFYPVLLPLLLYLLWHWAAVRRARKNGSPIPRFRDGPIFTLLMASLGMAALCFLALGFSAAENHNKGSYIPPHIEDGKVIEGQVRP
jgi:hypothetical protein